MFRAILDSVVLYPSDAVSTEKLVQNAAGHQGIVYIRTSRNATPILYSPAEDFPIGGSKVLKKVKMIRLLLSQPELRCMKPWMLMRN
jgi:transketolase